MKRSEELELKLKELDKEDEKAKYKVIKDAEVSGRRDHESVWSSYWNGFGREAERKRRELKEEIRKEQNREIQVGDGVTYHLYSDSHACTVIRRTKNKIVMQEDTATLDPSFKPIFVPGGFCAHCTNQNEQKWLYERNPNGSIVEAYWSEKYGAFMYYGKCVTIGRREFYDYNF